MKKIAVVGCGAVGLNYGTRLLESELFAGGAKVQQSIDVSLVVRRDYKLLTSHGVRVKYGRSGCSELETSDLLLSGENLRGKVYPTTQALFSCKGCMTWIIVCCKSYSICSQFLESLECIADDSTKFLIIMNGLDVESSFVEWFGAGRVFGGLAKIACNRGPNPPQLEPGPLVLQCFADISLEIGHVLNDELLLCEARQLFANTAISSIVQVTSNLLRSRWDKLCWNITFTGISVAMGGLTCDVIVGDASLRMLAARVIADVVRVANADLRRQHQQRTLPCPDLNLIPEEETIGR
jgi:2-dehydropantoate 2-reductase